MVPDSQQATVLCRRRLAALKLHLGSSDSRGGVRRGLVETEPKLVDNATEPENFEANLRTLSGSCVVACSCAHIY